MAEPLSNSPPSPTAETQPEPAQPFTFTASSTTQPFSFASSNPSSTSAFDFHEEQSDSDENANPEESDRVEDLEYQIDELENEVFELKAHIEVVEAEYQKQKEDDAVKIRKLQATLISGGDASQETSALVTSLEKRNVELEDEIYALKYHEDELEAEQLKHDILRSPSEIAKERELLENITELQTEISQLKTYATAQNEKLEAAQTSDDAPGSQEHANQEHSALVAHLRSEISKLQNEIQQVKSHAQEVEAAFRQQTSADAARLQELREQANAAFDKKTGDEAGRLQKFREEAEAAFEKHKSDATHRFQKLQEDAEAALEKQKSDDADELQKFKEDAEAAFQQQATLGAARLQQLKEEADDAAKIAQQNVDRLQQEKQDLKEKLQSNTRKELRIEELENELYQLRSHVEKIETGSVKQTEKAARLQRLQADADEATKAAQKTMEDLRQENQSLQGSLNVTKQEKESAMKFARKVNDGKLRLDRARTAAEEEVQRLSRKNADLMQERKETLENFNSVQGFGSPTFQHQETTIKSLTAEIEGLKRDQRNVDDTAAVLRRDLKEKAKNLEKAEVDLTQAQMQLKTREELVEKLRTKADDLEKKVESIAARDAEIAQLQSLNGRLQKDIDSKDLQLALLEQTKGKKPELAHDGPDDKPLETVQEETETDEAAREEVTPAAAAPAKRRRKHRGRKSKKGAAGSSIEDEQSVEGSHTLEEDGQAGLGEPSVSETSPVTEGLQSTNEPEPDSQEDSNAASQTPEPTSEQTTRRPLPPVHIVNRSRYQELRNPMFSLRDSQFSIERPSESSEYGENGQSDTSSQHEFGTPRPLGLELGSQGGSDVGSQLSETEMESMFPRPPAIQPRSYTDQAAQTTSDPLLTEDEETRTATPKQPSTYTDQAAQTTSSNLLTKDGETQTIKETLSSTPEDEVAQTTPKALMKNRETQTIKETLTSTYKDQAAQTTSAYLPTDDEKNKPAKPSPPPTYKDQAAQTISRHVTVKDKETQTAKPSPPPVYTDHSAQTTSTLLPTRDQETQTADLSLVPITPAKRASLIYRILTHKSTVLLFYAFFFLLCLLTLFWSLYHQRRALAERNLWLNANDVSRRSVIALRKAQSRGYTMGWMWEEKLVVFEEGPYGYPEKYGRWGVEY